MQIRVVKAASSGLAPLPSPRPTPAPVPFPAPPRRRGVRIRIRKPRKRGVIIRIAAPGRSASSRSVVSGVRVVASIAIGEVRLLVVRGSGAALATRRYHAELPARAVAPGLEAPNLVDAESVRLALRELWRSAGIRRIRPGSAAVVIPDQAVRMAVIALDGSAPGRRETEAIGRWGLRHLLPVAGDEARIDCAVVESRDAVGAQKWILAIGAATAVVREYESVLGEFGLSVGRVIPTTLAVATAHDRNEPDGPGARLVLVEAGGRLAGLVEAGGIPRLHRAWRGRPRDLTRELQAIDRYMREQADLRITEALLAGPRRWRARARRSCAVLGWRCEEVSLWAAHDGAAP